jgi:hypothetical protein
VDAESTERRKRTAAILTERGIPFRGDLPVLACSKHAALRGQADVALRSLALCVVMLKALEYPRESYTEALESKDVRVALSPDERAFLSNEKPTDFDMAQFSWRGEACRTLLWSLGLIETLGPPTDQFDAEELLDIFTDGWRARATLRPKDEVFDEHDIIYLYHWAVRGALVGTVQCNEVIPSVVIERHYSLNWLIAYCNQEWDEVTTDT